MAVGSLLVWLERTESIKRSCWKRKDEQQREDVSGADRRSRGKPRLGSQTRLGAPPWTSEVQMAPGTCVVGTHHHPILSGILRSEPVTPASEVRDIFHTYCIIGWWFTAARSIAGGEWG